ncbi:MAG: hypothetical protein AB1449_07020 [Chloroflexota bacterium]
MNCLRTLPYLRAWHERYADVGLEVVGVHAPEFRFARSREQVRAAVGRLGMRWPVMLDNEFRLWSAYANSYWPSLYLIDTAGYIRFRHAGEGNYAAIERAIQRLLAESGKAVPFDEVVPPVRPEDAPGALCLPTTPELHMDAIGNPGPLATVPMLFAAPPQRSDGHFYLEGLWRAVDEGWTLAGEQGGIVLPYHAASVNAVLAASPDPVDFALSLYNPAEVQLSQDGQPLPKDHFAEDVYLAQGQARVRVDVPRMYALVRNPDVRQRELRLDVRGQGLTLYAFSFGSCLAGEIDSLRPLE